MLKYDQKKNVYIITDSKGNKITLTINQLDALWHRINLLIRKNLSKIIKRI